ncbi:hypothetical protein C8R43DRAFT_952774 [Mycena crocata]|nr:hypothetical protein C8R43DRAFT_965286 [Mycena crocata]KAJ7148166.1 hypothetical protein C8R43DRAFT_952774 [Mycena crocata]
MGLWLHTPAIARCIWSVSLLTLKNVGTEAGMEGIMVAFYQERRNCCLRFFGFSHHTMLELASSSVPGESISVFIQELWTELDALLDGLIQPFAKQCTGLIEWCSFVFAYLCLTSLCCGAAEEEREIHAARSKQPSPVRIYDVEVEQKGRGDKHRLAFMTGASRRKVDVRSGFNQDRFGSRCWVVERREGRDGSGCHLITVSMRNRRVPSTPFIPTRWNASLQLPRRDSMSPRKSTRFNTPDARSELNLERRNAGLASARFDSMECAFLNNPRDSLAVVRHD